MIEGLLKSNLIEIEVLQYAIEFEKKMKDLFDSHKGLFEEFSQSNFSKMKIISKEGSKEIQNQAQINEVVTKQQKDEDTHKTINYWFYKIDEESLKENIIFEKIIYGDDIDPLDRGIHYVKYETVNNEKRIYYFRNTIKELSINEIMVKSEHENYEFVQDYNARVGYLSSVFKDKINKRIIYTEVTDLEYSARYCLLDDQGNQKNEIIDILKVVKEIPKENFKKNNYLKIRLEELKKQGYKSINKILKK